MTLTNETVSGNLAGGNGGGIYNDSELTLVNVTVSGNTSSGLGGGVHNDGGTISMVNVTVMDNTAAAGGGGIANLLNGTIFGASVTVANNVTTTGDGGGILNEDSSVCLSSEATFSQCFTGGEVSGNSLVTGNRAIAGNGGGIANDFGTLVVSDSTVEAIMPTVVMAVVSGTSSSRRWCPRTPRSATTAQPETAAGSPTTRAWCAAPRGNNFGINLTIAQNQARGNGGGVYTTNLGQTVLGSSTIADNTAAGSGRRV